MNDERSIFCGKSSARSSGSRKKRARKKSSTKTQPDRRSPGSRPPDRPSPPGSARRTSDDADRSVEHGLDSQTESLTHAVSRGELLPPFRERGDRIEATVLRSTPGHAARAGEMSLGRSSSASRPVGAWYADHGTQVSMAVAQSQSQLEAIMPEVIIGTDDRVEVHDTLHYPYGCLCSLEITAANHRAFVGTGWLIDPQTVITAGHCVYMARQGGWARGISVFPGRNGDQKPKQARASRLFSVLGWTRDTAPRHDYGCIRLSEPIDDVGTFGYSALADTDLAEYRCHVVGYPGDKPFTMWGHVRRLREVRPRTLVYEIDTYGGNSGAPVFVVENQQVFAVGIHNYGDLSGNLATRITDEVFTNLDGWKT